VARKTTDPGSGRKPPAWTDGRALGSPRRSDRPVDVVKWLFPSLVLLVIAGAGGFIAVTSLLRGDLIGTVFGIFFAVAAFVSAARRVIRRIMGTEPRKTPKVGARSWSFDDPDP